MVEYAHLVVKLDLKDAMLEVKEACQNIQQTADHCRQHAHGMDIHELMLRQDDLCEAYITRLQNQIYALGSEVRVKGMTDPFTSNRDKRQYQKEKGADESYVQLVKRVKKEGMEGFLKKMGLPLTMKDEVGDRSVVFMTWFLTSGVIICLLGVRHGGCLRCQKKWVRCGIHLRL